jgi:DNA-binding PadR family transcriptional regulator
MVAQNIVKAIKQYQKKWLQHVERMDTNRLPKQAQQYKPKGRRNIEDILRTKEQDTRRILHEHDDDDDEVGRMYTCSVTFICSQNFLFFFRRKYTFIFFY